MWENIWSKILDLRSDVLAALFFGCSMILMLANNHMFYANEIPRPGLGGILALGVISLFLWLSKLIMVISAAIKKKLGAREIRLSELGQRSLSLSRRISDTIHYSLGDSLNEFRPEIVAIFLHLQKDGFEIPQRNKGLR